MIAICPDFFTIGLEKQFRRILKKRQSQDKPINSYLSDDTLSPVNHSPLNSQLKVQAVDFRHWQWRCLGIMITPWFMNLMLLPNEGDEWQDVPLGTKTLFQFPSGKYEFILAEEEGIGRFQVHPIFQPMTHFDNQESAVQLAQQGLLVMMREDDMSASSHCSLRQVLV